MASTTDAAEKRNRFSKVYEDIYVRVAKKVGAKVALQGTLAPDRIESGATGGAVIKRHHNIGLNMGNLAQLHPISSLFKYEVRALAKQVGLPKSVWNRQPFPGPGLFLRVIGVPAVPRNVEIVRWADARVREILIKHDLYEQISQLVVAYFGVKTVGVKGEKRVYGGSIVVRPVETIDFMTANGIHLPNLVKDEIDSVVSKHSEIVQVLHSHMKKPPTTIEFE